GRLGGGPRSRWRSARRLGRGRSGSQGLLVERRNRSDAGACATRGSGKAQGPGEVFGNSLPINRDINSQHTAAGGQRGRNVDRNDRAVRSITRDRADAHTRWVAGNAVDGHRNLRSTLVGDNSSGGHRAGSNSRRGSSRNNVGLVGKDYGDRVGTG